MYIYKWIYAYSVGTWDDIWLNGSPSFYTLLILWL